MSPLLSSFVVATLTLLMNMGMSYFSSFPSASAASPVERIALQLNGPLCVAQHAHIISILSPLPGVRAVDLSSVPGHALVDLDTEVLSPQNLVETVLRLWQHEDACLVEPMQSCISAGPLGQVGVPSANHADMVH
jgi:hypothetical protein